MEGDFNDWAEQKQHSLSWKTMRVNKVFQLNSTTTTILGNFLSQKLPWNFLLISNNIVSG